MSAPMAHSHPFTEPCNPYHCPVHPDQTENFSDRPTVQEWWDQVREIGAQHGFDFSTITLNGTSLDIKSDPKSLGYDISGGEDESDPDLTKFQKRVLGILSQSHDVYKDRSAVYKDNFRSVGRVMVALFPEGRPPLIEAADYDRWHIFELLIVKLTRYANNYDQPHEDSLLDQLPYLGILGALDQELRERQKGARDESRDQLLGDLGLKPLEEFGK